MTECSQLDFELPGFSGRKIEGNFEGGNVSSDGGLVLLRQVDRWIGLTKSLAKRLPDKRDPDKIEHCLERELRDTLKAYKEQPHQIHHQTGNNLKISSRSG